MPGCARCSSSARLLGRRQAGAPLLVHGPARTPSMLPVGNISSAYRKPHTCRQHHAALTGGMTYSEPAPTAARRTRSPASSTSPAVPTMGITIYGCGQDEAVLFREMAPRFGVMPTITEAAASEANIYLAFGNRCISVGHKTQITNSTLLALSQAGVTYISTRSIGYNHINVKYAESAGISVENVAYSPDSVLPRDRTPSGTPALRLLLGRRLAGRESGLERTPRRCQISWPRRSQRAGSIA